MTGLRGFLLKIAEFCRCPRGRAPTISPRVVDSSTGMTTTSRTSSGPAVNGDGVKKDENRIRIEPAIRPVFDGMQRRMVIEPIALAPLLHVTRRPSTYWEDRGWIRDRDRYDGYFGINGRMCPGVISWGSRGLKSCLVSNPPQELWTHPHAGCFAHVGNGTYAVHFKQNPKSVDAAIMTVERIIKESIERR